MTNKNNPYLKFRKSLKYHLGENNQKNLEILTTKTELAVAKEYATIRNGSLKEFPHKYCKEELEIHEKYYIKLMKLQKEDINSKNVEEIKNLMFKLTGFKYMKNPSIVFPYIASIEKPIEFAEWIEKSKIWRVENCINVVVKPAIEKMKREN